MSPSQFLCPDGKCFVLITDWDNVTEYDCRHLTAGMNLAENFYLSLFSIPFRCVDDLVFQEQSVESAITWRPTNVQWIESSLAAYEAEQIQWLNQIKGAFVPVTHNIRIEVVE